MARDDGEIAFSNRVLGSCSAKKGYDGILICMETQIFSEVNLNSEKDEKRKLTSIPYALRQSAVLTVHIYSTVLYSTVSYWYSNIQYSTTHDLSYRHYFSWLLPATIQYLQVFVLRTAQLH